LIVSGGKFLRRGKSELYIKRGGSIERERKGKKSRHRKCTISSKIREIQKGEAGITARGRKAKQEKKGDQKGTA